jgi:23S rRNA (pseudouridine1915-N3)-methyltransferase
MQIHLITVAKRPAPWVEEGFREFAKRLPEQCRLRTVRLPPGHRTGANCQARLQREGERMLAAIPAGAHVVALDVHGVPWSTEQFAEQLAAWLRDGPDVALLVGGPDGLSAACRLDASQVWSLSPLTLPHALVTVVLAEQIYRAWSILHRHPYHRSG